MRHRSGKCGPVNFQMAVIRERFERASNTDDSRPRIALDHCGVVRARALPLSCMGTQSIRSRMEDFHV